MSSSSTTNAMESIPIMTTLSLGPNRRIVATARNHELIMDSRKDWGGEDAGPTPAECLTIALGGCVLNICRIIAAERQIGLQGLRVSITGDIDPSRAFGLATNNRAGFSHLSVKVTFTSKLSPEEKEDFQKEFTSRCPLCDTIANPTPLETTFA